MLFIGMSILSSIFMVIVPDSNVQLIFSQLGMWLIPALLYMWIIYRKEAPLYLCLRSFDGKSFVFFLLIYLLFTPFIDYLQTLNRSIVFPESWAAMEAFFRKLETLAEESLKGVLLQLGQGKILLVLLSMAVLPALCEEFFFRGVLLSELLTVRVNKHLAVWVTAFIFSAIHFQFYGLFPRWLLGAVLGYAFVYSRSLWLPVFLHFINNASVVCAYYAFHKGWTTFNPETDLFSIPLWITISAAIVAVGSFLFFITSRNTARSNSE